MKTVFTAFHEELNEHLSAMGTYPADHDKARDAFNALGPDRAYDAATAVFFARQDEELEQALARLPSPAYVDLCQETTYGTTERLTFQIRVF